MKGSRLWDPPLLQPEIPKSLCLGFMVREHKAEQNFWKAHNQLLSERIRHVPFHEKCTLKQDQPDPAGTLTTLMFLHLRRNL